jgi:RNA polymerase sigma-70 factor (ECF subfamily)
MRSATPALSTAGEADEAPRAVGDEATTAADVPWPEIVRLVRGTVRRIVGPSRELDDLTQTALERVVRALDTFEGRAELTTFVYRIAANVALNHWRGWRRWLRRFDPSADAAAEDHEADDVGPLAAHAARERARHLHRLLGQLDADHRIVIVLADFEELSGARIAEILAVPEGTVRSRLRLARAKLTSLILAEPFFREEIGG